MGEGMDDVRIRRPVLALLRRLGRTGTWTIAAALAGVTAVGCASQAERPQAESLQAPPGFRVEVFAEGLHGPRWLSFGPDGRLYVSLPREGRVVALPDADADGRADRVETVVDELGGPHGLAWKGDTLWVSESTRILRLRYRPGGPEARAFEIVVDGLTDGAGHSTRTILFDPSGEFLYVAVGSSCNLCEETDPRRGTVLRFRADGSQEEVFARGLRNAVGLAFHPTTRALWATVNERDWLGDDLPPDELDIVRKGSDHGWPYCYGDRVANPEYASAYRCADVVPPALAFPAHSAPLGIAFYTDSAFPEAYRGDAFVAFHGSWNRSTATGYKLVHVEVEDGAPLRVHDFVSGWLTPDGRVWGRPVDVRMGSDGALYVSDDRGGRIWRITHGPARAGRAETAESQGGVEAGPFTRR
ncbi:MAG: PQQ-dependent sugar dehydrogenase [Gemmatimonadota bacterium]